MLEKALRLIGSSEAASSEELATRLGVVTAVAGGIIDQLARLGYLRPSGEVCVAACANCAQGPACFGSARLWTLTEKGRRAAARRPERDGGAGGA